MSERVERQPAFVLHERPYRETSALLDVFTRDHGRVGLVVRGLRAAKPRFARGTLRSFQSLECAWTQRGELGHLTAAESRGTPANVGGQRLQSLLYVNELLTRLLPRHDPHPEVFDAYAALVVELPDALDAMGFALRRFEKFLLESLGYGIDFAIECRTQTAVAPDGRYRVIPEHGVVAVAALDAEALAGSSLLALADGVQPDAISLRDLRRMMRGLLLHHLGGRPLQAWRVLKAAPAPD